MITGNITIAVDAVQFSDNQIKGGGSFATFPETKKQVELTVLLFLTFNLNL